MIVQNLAGESYENPSGGLLWVLLEALGPPEKSCLLVFPADDFETYLIAARRTDGGFFLQMEIPGGQGFCLPEGLTFEQAHETLVRWAFGRTAWQDLGPGCPYRRMINGWYGPLMPLPELIRVAYEPNFRTEHIGRYASGQFFADAHGTPLDDSGITVMLHLFDHVGRHVRSDIRPDVPLVSAEEVLGSMLAELPDLAYGDIAIRLFQVEVEGSQVRAGR
jgi:formate hydrogenlyase regulatory protein HycA